VSVDTEAARREFLTCRLGDESYGIDILQVQEIREVRQVTRVPHVSHYVRGVVNLRGAIVPVVDLGLMFGFDKPIDLAEASAIVLNVDGRLVGIVVTAVSDVIALADDEILPAPELAARKIGTAIAGIGTRKPAEGEAPKDARDASVLLLDVATIMRRIREDAE
jgi:purine-binding chemotaxis protein CheW